jgi:F0F1-type ATP synthase beta subunit
VRQAIAVLWAAAPHAGHGADALMLERALKLQNYFTQPLFVTERWTERPGTTVSLAEALQTCRDILDGRYDDLPTDAFWFSGGMAEIQGNVGRTLKFGPVTWPPRTQ